MTVDHAEETDDSGPPRTVRPARRGHRGEPTEPDDHIVIAWPDPSPLESWWRHVVGDGHAT